MVGGRRPFAFVQGKLEQALHGLAFSFLDSHSVLEEVEAGPSGAVPKACEHRAYSRML